MISFVAFILIIMIYIIPLNIPIYNLSNSVSVNILNTIYNDGFTDTSRIALTSTIYLLIIAIIFLVISLTLYLLQRNYVVERGENLYKKINDEILKYNKGLSKLNIYGTIIIAILIIIMIIMGVVDIRPYVLGVLLVVFILKQDIKINSDNVDVEAIKKKRELKELAREEKNNLIEENKKMVKNNGKEIVEKLENDEKLTDDKINIEEKSKRELQNIISRIQSTNNKEKINKDTNTILNQENSSSNNENILTDRNVDKENTDNRPNIKRAVRIVSDKRHSNIDLKIKEDEKFKYKTLKWSYKLDSDNKNETIPFEAKFRLNDRTKVTNTKGIIYEKSVDEFGTQIKYICDKREFTIKEKISVVLALVSSFNHDNNYRKNMFSPREVIEKERGNSIELAICASYILRSMDLDVEEINTKDVYGNRKVAIAVEGADNEKGIFYDKNGKKYYYCELISKNKFSVGQMINKER